MSLINTSLLDALEHILTEESSGVLTTAQVDQAHRRLHIVGGKVVFASSLAPAGRLLDRLRADGRLTEAQYQQALTSLQETGRKAGQVLLTLKLFTEQEVISVLEEQIYGNLRALLEDPAIPVRFLPIRDLTVEAPHPEISLPDALFRAFDGVDIERLAERYPLDEVHCFRQSATPWTFVHRFPFDSDAATVLSLVEAGRPAGEIARLAELGLATAARHLFLLAYLGLIEPSAAPAAGKEPRQRAAASAIPATPATAVDTPPEEALSEEARQIQEELLGLDRRLDEMDHFQVLRVNVNHPLATIKDSYRTLSKRLHPDIVRGYGLTQPMVEVAERVYAKMSVAYDILTHTDKRRAYLKQQQQQGSGPAHRPSFSDPDTIFANARKALSAGEFDRAVQLLTNLIGRFPDRSDLHFSLATAYAGMRGRKREAEQELKRAIELEPTNPNYYVGLGNLYRSGGIVDKALQMYRAALRWDGKNRYAQKAIRELETASKGQEERGVSSLLSRFRK
jgi:tetratricopeptide (TPR) repeat protein